MHYFPSNMPILNDRLTQAWEGSWLRKCFAHSPTPSHIPWGKALGLFGVTSPVGQLWPLETAGTRDQILHGCFCFSEVYYNQGHTYICTCMCMCICMYVHTHTHVHIYVLCVCVYTYIWQAVAKPVGHILMDRTPNLVRHHIPFLWLALILYSSFYSLRIWDSEVLLPCSPARFLTPPALLFSLIELQCSRGRWGLN